MKIFFYKNFSWLKKSRVWSLMSANTYFVFQGTLAEDYCSLKADLENQTLICVYLSTFSSSHNFSKAVTGLQKGLREEGNPFKSPQI